MPDMVILFEPFIDDSLCPASGSNTFSVEDLSAKGSVKALHNSHSPRDIPGII
jgi:hypothetical protein